MKTWGGGGGGGGGHMPPVPPPGSYAYVYSSYYTPVDFLIHGIYSLSTNVVVSRKGQKFYPIRNGQNSLQTLKKMAKHLVFNMLYTSNTYQEGHIHFWYCDVCSERVLVPRPPSPPVFDCFRIRELLPRYWRW